MTSHDSGSAGYDDPFNTPDFRTSALLTIDVQRDFLSESPYGIPGTTEALPAIRRATELFRRAGRPVVHVVRLYDIGGGNAEISRRRLLGTGVDLVAPGTPGSQLADGLAPAGAPDLDPVALQAGQPQELGPDEFALFKPRWGGFYATPLEAVLRARGVDTLVVVGCNFPNCPRATMVEASERDFKVVAISDAMSRVTELGLSEVAGLGVHVMSLDELAALMPGVGQ